MNESTKLALLDLASGDVEKARLMCAWLNEAAEPQVPQVPEGIMLTDKEVMGLDAEALKELAMLRVAQKQNEPEAKVVDRG